jgi:Tfp pilus assembly protein PilF
MDTSMSMRHQSGWRRAAAAGVAMIAGCGLLLGCASLPPAGRAAKELDRATRRGKDLASFEAKRDEAQFAAARERADQGDPAAAEALLLSLLERSPNHQEARLLLADLWVAQDRTDKAEAELRTLLKQSPDNARAHHSLGLLCDVTSRAAEAQQHFQRAAELNPQEETFRLSLEASSAAK